MTQPTGAHLARFSINALRIGASTVAVVELLRQHWISAGCFALAWLLTIQVERHTPEDPDVAEGR